ncbi:MAG: hypothetical protein KDA91_05025 [Planctomycetaceae bacterium]|nr:hypothetical protein [Planctomycetaceae bacterium]
MSTPLNLRTFAVVVTAGRNSEQVLGVHVKTVRRYFVTDLSSYFWWSAPGGELCWSDGTSISFHQEISCLLNRMLQADRFADISSIALALAASRKSWPEIVARLSVVVTAIRKATESPSGISRRDELTATWLSTTTQLGLLSKAAEQGHLTLDERIELLSHVLSCRDTSYNEATRRDLVQAFDARLPEDWLDVSNHDELTPYQLPNDPNAFDFRKLPKVDQTQLSLRVLRLLRIAHNLAQSIPGDTPEALISLVRTGLSHPAGIQPTDAILDSLPPAVRMQKLLVDLTNDSELGGLARVAKQLVAAISLPRHISDPDDRPMGGVSDIANRGSLDKLLLSELAQDDLALSVRLAMNEALYLRRESPPSPQPSTRFVLIDGSLPMWGIPRLYATAAAMALYVTSDQSTEVRCFRTEGRRSGDDWNIDSLQPDDTAVESTLISTDGIALHLSGLAPNAFPTKSLDEFFETVRMAPVVSEPVVITTPDVVESQEFRQRLESQWNDEAWLIVVQRDGQLEILRWTRQGTSLHRRLSLPLQQIIVTSDASHLRATEASLDLPAICHLRSFPLRLSHHIRTDRIWSWGKSVVSITDDGRLMIWDSPSHGAQQIAEELPVSTGDRCFLLNRWGGIFSLLACPQNKTATLIQIEGQQLKVTLQLVEHTLPEVTDVCRSPDGVLMFGQDTAGKTMCVCFDYPAGTAGKALRLPDNVTRRCGRCVRTTDRGYGLLSATSSPGQSLWSFQRLPEAIQHWDMAELSAGRYLALNDKYQLVDPDDPNAYSALRALMKQRTMQAERIVIVSPDGDLALLRLRNSSNVIVVDLKNETIAVEPRTTENPPQMLLDGVERRRAEQAIRIRPLHYRYRRIGSDGRRLWLQSMKAGYFLIENLAVNAAGQIQLRPATTSEANVAKSVPMMSFDDQEGTIAMRIKLQRATWPGKSQAWLDTRGLLHLKSAIRSVPEVCLVLRDHAISGWISNGHVFGDPYYIDGGLAMPDLKRIDASEAWLAYIVPLLESMS